MKYPYLCYMGRIMAIDYGTKRVGIAVTDPNQLIANGLTTIHAKELVSFIQQYLQSETLDCIVIGEPKRMNNDPSDVEVYIQQFIKHLSRVIPNLLVKRMDERFTSKIAFQSMIDGGLKKKARQDKGTVDMVSATLILQSYMEINPKI